MPTKSVSNEDIMQLLQELMQMSSDRFEKQQSWNKTFQSGLDALTTEVKEMKQTLRSHDLQFAEMKESIKKIANEQKAQVSDISDILDRLKELGQKAKKTEAEQKEMQSILQQLLDWARLATKNLKIPLRVH